MTTSNTNVRSGPYNGDGVSTNYQITFYFLLASEVKVTRKNADGTLTTLALTTDYTVTGAGIGAGGYVILNSAATAPVGSTITITPNPSIVQGQAYPPTGIFPSLACEQGFDRLTIVANFLQEQINRCIKLGVTTAVIAATAPPIADPIAGNLLGWNNTATALVNYTPSAVGLLTAIYQDGSGNISINNPASVTAGLGVDINAITGFPAGTAAAPSITNRADTDTGIYFPAANTVGIAARGLLSAQFTNPASAINYWTLQGSAIGSGIFMAAAGSDTDIPMNVATKGVGALTFYNGNGNNVLLTLAPAASAVNYLGISNAATGNGPVVFSLGANTNADLNFATKGTGSFYFRTDFAGANGLQFLVVHTASVVNQCAVTGSTAGNQPLFFASGTDTDIGLQYISKGAGFHAIRTGGTGSPLSQMFITHTASAVNYWSFTGAASGSAVAVIAGGSDANIQMSYTSKGNLGHTFQTNSSGANTQFQIRHIASAVNYMYIQGNVTSSGPSLIATGSDTNVDLNFHSQAAGNIFFRTNSAIRAAFDGNGNFYVNTAQLATNATSGFLWATSSAGAPTGAATAPYTGAVAMHYDATNNFLYIRSGGTWRKSTVYA